MRRRNSSSRVRARRNQSRNNNTPISNKLRRSRLSRRNLPSLTPRGRFPSTSHSKDLIRIRRDIYNRLPSCHKISRVMCPGQRCHRLDPIKCPCSRCSRTSRWDNFRLHRLHRHISSRSHNTLIRSHNTPRSKCTPSIPRRCRKCHRGYHISRHTQPVIDSGRPNSIRIPRQVSFLHRRVVRRVGPRRIMLRSL
jgi:hypothetical protein